MKQILGTVESFAPGQDRLQKLTVDQIRANDGHEIKSYSELVSNLAKLAFANPEFVLLMRGQSRDYTEDSKTILFPAMYRRRPSVDHYNAYELADRYGQLRRCEERLYEALREFEYWDRVGRSELARWAILQHYGVCLTPLLDVTHSALVACSFAFLGPARDHENHFVLYVLGVPQINGAITVSPAHALQVVRLSSVCPPETLRPYFQEAYLLGNYPSVDTLDEKMRYERSEMDCAQRLVAKFKILRSTKFWDNGFHPLPDIALYPEEKGALCSKLAQLKRGS